jgi:predicted nucleic acid-binding protein
VRFWDTSALAPLFVDEATTEQARQLLVEDPGVLVWIGTSVELVSALARLRRTSTGASDLLLLARREVLQRWPDWTIISDPASVTTRAQRLVDVHPLKTLDALQLAAALVASLDRPASLPIVTADRHLATAAELEGFPVVSLG